MYKLDLYHDLMRQRHIETFFAVMTYGTVTQAAARLGVTQPSVTLTLRQAEKELGFALFDRRGGRLTPTTEARALYEEVARAHASFAAINNLCSQLQKGEVTQLRVVATQTLTESVIPCTVQRFVADHRGYDIDALTDSSNGILESMDLRTDEFDLGFIFGDVGDHGVHQVDIAASPLYCVYPADWKLQTSTARNELDLKALSSRPYIGLSETEPVGQIGRSLILDAGLSPEIHIRAQNHRLAGEMAARGLGYALLDYLSAAAVASNNSNTVSIAPIAGADPIPITAVLARANDLTRKTRNFIEHFTAAFQQALPSPKNGQRGAK